MSLVVAETVMVPETPAPEAGVVTVAVGAVGGVIAVAGRTSMTARFQRSFVGAVSLIVTGAMVPPVFGAVWRCTQNVSPALGRY